MVEYITYKGQKYPVRISYSALKHIRKELGKEVSELVGTEDVTYMEIMLWYGLVSGHKAEDKELLLDRSEVEFILDESLTEFNNILLSTFPPAIGIEDDKKK